MEAAMSCDSTLAACETLGHRADSFHSRTNDSGAMMLARPAMMIAMGSDALRTKSVLANTMTRNAAAANTTHQLMERRRPSTVEITNGTRSRIGGALNKAITGIEEFEIVDNHRIVRLALIGL